jgi:hypothetical protein
MAVIMTKQLMTGHFDNSAKKTKNNFRFHGKQGRR